VQIATKAATPGSRQNYSALAILFKGRAAKPSFFTELG
jgi:hypothetical protein